MSSGECFQQLHGGAPWLVQGLREGPCHPGRRNEAAEERQEQRVTGTWPRSSYIQPQLRPSV